MHSFFSTNVAVIIGETFIAKGTPSQADLRVMARRSREQIIVAFLTFRHARQITPAAIAAAKSAASVMAMNNIYYRFVHLASNKEYATMPARLRVNVIANPGVDKADFELWSLAVSAINGCGACIDAHEKALNDAGVASTTIRTAVRFAAIIQSVAIAIEAGAIELATAAE